MKHERKRTTTTVQHACTGHCAYALLNNRDQAIRWLQTAADDRFPCYPLFEHDDNLNSLRRDPRFVAFLTQMNARLQQYQATL